MVLSKKMVYFKAETMCERWEFWKSAVEHGSVILGRENTSWVA